MPDGAGSRLLIEDELVEASPASRSLDRQRPEKYGTISRLTTPRMTRRQGCARWRVRGPSSKGKAGERKPGVHAISRGLHFAMMARDRARVSGQSDSGPTMPRTVAGPLLHDNVGVNAPRVS